MNYYGKFLPDLSNLLAPLYRLLHKDTKWSWGADQEQAFREVKQLLTSECLLVHFDPNKELLIACDASPYGLGAVLSHRGPDREEQPIAFASRSLNPAEKNYSQLEKEGLAIVFAIKKFHQFLYGRRFTITSDHKPLQHLLKPSNAVPTMASGRMQRWALLLSGYDYAISYKPGTQHSNADSLSRLPLPESPVSVPLPPETIHLMEQLDSSPVTSSQIKQWTEKDPLLSKVKDLVLRGGCHTDVEVVTPYHKYWSELSVHAGCLLRGNRVVIPPQGRANVMELLHEGHPGNSRMKSLARSYVWWPGIDRDLEDKVKSCDLCQKIRHSPATAPLHPWEFPKQPWERLHADFAGPFLGKMFLIVVDSYSKWLEVVPLSSATSSLTIDSLRSIFATHGLPKEFVTDNGTQFSSTEFKEFMTSNGVRQIFSPPYHPSSNGLAERAVQSFKDGMKKFSTSEPLEKRISKFLFLYRLTPHSTTGIAPAELLLRRIPRSKFDLIKPDLLSSVRQKQEAQKKFHDTHSKERHFCVGDPVFVKEFPSGKTWTPGTVSAVKGPVSYCVELPDGRVMRRHVDHIRNRTSNNETVEPTHNDLEIPTPTTVAQPAQPPESDNNRSPDVMPEHSSTVRQSTRNRVPPDYLRY